MATLFQAPFWVPRPGWDEPWLFKPYSDVTLFERFKPPQPYLTPKYYYDDASFWQGTPSPSYIAYNNINFTQFGSPGQVLTKNWAGQILQYDDTSVWYEQIEQPLVNFNEFLITLQMCLPTDRFKEQNVQSTIDDPFWATTPAQFNSRVLRYLAEQGYFGQPGQAVQSRQNWGYDDYSYWVGTPTPVNYKNNAPSTAAIPFPSPMYVTRPGDDYREWQGKQVAGYQLQILTAQTMFGQAGQVLPFLPNLTLDDPPVTRANPISTNVPLAKLLTLAQGPRPLSIYYEIDITNDDPAFWVGQGRSAAQSLLATSVAPGQPLVAPFYVLTGGSDYTIWLGAPVSSPSTPPVQQPQYLPPTILWSPDDPDDAATFPFSFPAQPPYKLLFIPPTPSQNGFLLQNTQYLVEPYGDDPAYWVGTPTTNVYLRDFSVPKIYSQGGQAPPFRPNFTLNDPPEFQGTPLSAYTNIAFAQNIFGRLGRDIREFITLFLDNDASGWYTQTMQQDYVALNTPIVYPPNQMKGLVTLTWRAAAFNYDVGEAPGWAGSPIGQDYQMTNPGAPVPAGPPGKFTVSGENVATFLPEFFSGVSYTDAPIPKRTDQ